MLAFSLFFIILSYSFCNIILFGLSDFLDIKLKSVKCYSSQFYDPESKEPKTPISTQNFLESIKYRSANFGRIIGADYGEGFVANRNPAVASISDLI